MRTMRSVRLIGGVRSLQPNCSTANRPDRVRRLLGHLVEFHRREDKPKWWEVYRRRDMTAEELFDDLASLGRLERIEGSEHAVRRSRAVRYRFDPDQDTKFDVGNKFFVSHDLELKGTVEELDRETGESCCCSGRRSSHRRVGRLRSTCR